MREHAYQKGQPNLTVSAFTQWINSTYNTTVHEETARRWLGVLGFSQVHHQKGVYFDGHDRDDVVAYRNEFLARMDNLDNRSIKFDGIAPELQAGEKPLIRVVHDKSTYFANCDQSYFWGDEIPNLLRQKFLRSSIMISDFVAEVSGFVRNGSDMARVSLETQRDGYFNSDQLLAQVEKTIEEIHPSTQGLFLFDYAPSHKKVADDSLNVDKMNVHPGGKQPAMRDSSWEGKTNSTKTPANLSKLCRCATSKDSFMKHGWL